MQVVNHSQREKKTTGELIKEIENKKNNTILVAEDETINRELIMDLFKEADFHSILLAANGKEAVDLALKHSPDLILMDMRMPMMDGKTAIAQLKTKGYTGPIVIISGMTLQEDIDQCLQAGAVGFITKPIDINEFFFQIGKFLKVKRDQGKEMTWRPGDPFQLKPGAGRVNEYKINDSISEKVRTVFLSDAEKKLVLIKGILDSGDFENKKDIIETIAHGYMGNAVFLGLSLLEETAAALERAFKDNAPLPTLIHQTMNLAGLLKRIIEKNTNGRQSVVRG